MEITITIKESENGKPSVKVKEEGNNPSPKPIKNQNPKRQNPRKANSKNKPKNSKIRSEEELIKRRKELLRIREQIKRDIAKSENPADLRRDLEMIEQTLVEYRWLFREIE